MYRSELPMDLLQPGREIMCGMDRAEFKALTVILRYVKKRLKQKEIHIVDSQSIVQADSDLIVFIPFKDLLGTGVDMAFGIDLAEMARAFSVESSQPFIIEEDTEARCYIVSSGATGGCLENVMRGPQPRNFDIASNSLPVSTIRKIPNPKPYQEKLQRYDHTDLFLYEDGTLCLNYPCPAFHRGKRTAARFVSQHFLQHIPGRCEVSIAWYGERYYLRADSFITANVELSTFEALEIFSHDAEALERLSRRHKRCNQAPSVVERAGKRKGKNPCKLCGTEAQGGLTP